MNKVVLITGGSRGIGAATVQLAVQQGYAVCFSYYSQQAKAKYLVAAIQKLGGQALAVQADQRISSVYSRLATKLLGV
jgi:NAD(P)-dependent dehydrogenase (short-subunit alcohol dehydrogenase family)